MEEAFKSANVERVRELLGNIKVDECLGEAFKKMLPLSFAAFIGNLAAVKVLLEKRADINELSGYSGFNCCYTPLWFAVYNNQIKMVEFLLSRIADPNKHYISAICPKPSCPTPLFAAAHHSNLQATKLLLSSPLIDATLLNSQAQSSKDLANNELIKKLIENKIYQQKSKKLDEEIRILELVEMNERIKNKETKIAQLSKKADELMSDISEKMNDLEILRMEMPVLQIELNVLNEKKKSLQVACNIHNFQVDDSVIECPCCLEIHYGVPSYQCRHGHHFCGNCAGNINVCPTCREPLDGRIRCLVLEKFLSEKQSPFL